MDCPAGKRAEAPRAPRRMSYPRSGMDALADLVSLGPAAAAGLVAAAVATAALSALVGMAGGITLLAVMLLFLGPLEAIPIHGAVQLVSNGSRTWLQRRAVRWEWVWPYALPLVPMGFLGLALLRGLPAEATRALIGAFVLVATWLPGVFGLGGRVGAVEPTRRFLALGSVAGVLNVTIGAVGPLIAPFYLGLGMSRFELIGTKAASQALGHVSKLLVFGVAGFAFGDYLGLLALLSAGVVTGTWLGTRLLGRVSERGFVILYKAVLTLIALRLVVVEFWRLLAA